MRFTIVEIPTLTLIVVSPTPVIGTAVSYTGSVVLGYVLMVCFPSISHLKFNELAAILILFPWSKSWFPMVIVMIPVEGV